jgi:hypothetical protein
MVLTVYKYPMVRRIFLFLTIVSSVLAAQAQSNAALPDAPQPVAKQADAPVALHTVPRDLWQDQRTIWTAPLHASDRAMITGIALIAVAGVAGSEDTPIMQRHFLDPQSNSHAGTAANGLTGLMVAAPVALYGMGRMRQDTHAEQTGLVAGEAIVDGLALNELMKIVSRRERPTVDNAKGRFFQPGVNWNSSFPSTHITIAWSSATVLATASRSRWIKIAAYSAAAGVSVARVAGRDHFPSDVVVGSALGWAVGRCVSHRHHLQNTLW